MELVAELLKITASGRYIAIIDEETAGLLGVHSSDRLRVAYRGTEVVAMANIAADFPLSHVGLYAEISGMLGIKGGELVEVQLAKMPESLGYVRAKIRGERLREKNMETKNKEVGRG